VRVAVEKGQPHCVLGDEVGLRRARENQVDNAG
jgi:hypothetical protein